MRPVGIYKSKPLENDCATPSKTPHPLPLCHQSMPSSERNRPAREESAQPTAEIAAADERQEQLRAIASDLLYWKGGLKVLRQARLPTWRGYFKWQIEAKIEALQTAYAKVRAETANEGG